MTPFDGAHPYLLIERLIPASVLAYLHFDGRIRIDVRGNAVFPHIGPGRRLRLRDKEPEFHVLMLPGTISPPAFSSQNIHNWLPCPRLPSLEGTPTPHPQDRHGSRDP
jgi:hypothetical protein